LPEVLAVISYCRPLIDAAVSIANNRWTASLLGKALMMSRELSDKKLAVLGTGKLGGILLRAYLKQGLFGTSRTTATVKHAERAAALANDNQLRDNYLRLALEYDKLADLLENRARR